MYASPEFDVASILVEAYFPTQTYEPSSTPSSTSSLAPGSSAISLHTGITQTMILKMVHLDHSTDVRATQLEIEVPLMIEGDISAALVPLRTSFGDITKRANICERVHGLLGVDDCESSGF